MYRIALAAVDAAGGVAAIANPEGAAVIVTRLALDVTASSTGACTVDAGIAANATTSADGLIDGLSVAATGVFDNVSDAGTNGRARAKWGAGQYLTISKASGATAGLAGTAYVDYVLA